ncbi:MAG TPA: nucleoside-triphosphatase [Phycisphaerae bacterium]|nr:nucleoside-triphosphatase [Phycisphaerae bacterium]
MTRATNILLVGPPGVGKTTVVMRLATHLKGRAVAGFYTQEIREAGQRRGFQAATFAGETVVMAHVDFRSKHRVGRYGVDVASFEQLVLPELARGHEIMLIDEIGKMEWFSSRFVEAVGRLLDGATLVVATVAIRGGGFIAQVKARPDAEIWQVTRQDRDELPQRLARRLVSTGSD